MLHHIQKHILDTLATSESMRYGQLKPAELDGNVFGYHLKQLIRDRYIEKTPGGDYLLTPTGKDYIVHRFEDHATSAHTIFLIVLRRGDQLLMRRRKVQPLIDKVGFVHGEPQPNESVVTTAHGRLVRKTGIDTKLTIMGSCTIAQYQSNELQSYSHAILLAGETGDELSIDADDTGENFWLAIDQLSSESVLPSCIDILGMIEHGKTWAELKYVLSHTK